MEITKETALRLWSKQFGKRIKAEDFAGREIAKASYNDRNSQFAWNVDHIKPQSQGGKTADYNLICCHVLTNDEKADRFPCFNANGKEFEIQKRENHYEIFRRREVDKEEANEDTDFLDSAQGIRVWRKCLKEKHEEYFVGYVGIRFKLTSENSSLISALRKFTEELFSADVIFIKKTGFIPNSVEFRIPFFDLPTKTDVQNMVDNCVILNTYAGYFEEKYGTDTNICCGMICFRDKETFSLDDFRLRCCSFNIPSTYSLCINEAVNQDLPEGDKAEGNSDLYGYYEYDKVFTKLQKNLNKLI